MTTLFISDLHLHPVRPAVTEKFLEFLQAEAGQSEALYILGDLFEVWIGDDDPDPHHRVVIDALSGHRDSGAELYIARGNRDVILGGRFCRETGAHLLEETTVIDLYGSRVLISHGDELCTDDHAYQRFRRQARSPTWRAIFLALPLGIRRYLASHLRRRSRIETALKPEDITDVSPEAVEEALAAHRVSTMIHGHTHRPGIYPVEQFRQTKIRIVLGDWYEQGSVLRWDESGYRLESLPLN